MHVAFCDNSFYCKISSDKLERRSDKLIHVRSIRKPGVAEILHSLFTYTPVRDDPNDNRCTYNIDNQYCLLLNILGDTSFSGIKHI